MRQIAGPELCGFWGMFESSYGDPATEEGMPTVTPSFVGNSLLPFRCPSCAEVPQDLACPKTREKYRDTRPGRSNHWCPLCGARFRLDERGTPLATALPAGAVVGPSRVERSGAVTWQDRPPLGLSVLGFLSVRRGVDYKALARM